MKKNNKKVSKMKLLEDCVSDSFTKFNFLVSKVNWCEGIKTRHNTMTRFQSHFDQNSVEVKQYLYDLIFEVLNKENLIITCYSIYCNYYRDGSDYCPKHRHEGTKQILISLGAERYINVNNTKIKLKSGSALFFDDEYHSIDKTLHSGPRISIVVFYS